MPIEVIRPRPRRRRPAAAAPQPQPVPVPPLVEQEAAIAAELARTGLV